MAMHSTQSFGIAEGRPKESLKNMANAAGQSCRDYTPPEGETLEQVSHNVVLHKLSISCATTPSCGKCKTL